jgi:hypothetical protein
VPIGACFAVFVISYKIEAARKSAKWLAVARALLLYFQALVIDINIMETKVEISTANDKHAAPVHINVFLHCFL